jgi:dihydroorotate dehydrogenase electron transfer subunit
MTSGSDPHSEPAAVYEGDTVIAENRPVAPDTFLLKWRSPEIATRAAPGQFVMIRTGTSLDPLLPRPFSICSVRDGGEIQVLYRVVGQGTAGLSRVPEGGRISVMGPLGNGFDLPGDKQPAVLVGGGIGIAPLVFLCERLDRPQRTFLMGFPGRDDLIPQKALGLPDASVHIATDDGSMGYAGLVTELLERRISNAGNPGLKVYACGPHAMLRRVHEITSQRQIGCQVSLEAHMACGLGACQGCAVEAAAGRSRTYYHVCRDGPVFDGRDIDWERI